MPCFPSYPDRMRTKSFAEVTALTKLAADPLPSGAEEFQVDIDADWTIGGKPNGGYLLASLAKGAIAVSPHRHVVAASATYLRPPEPGPAVISAVVLREGRSATQVRAALSQGGVNCVESHVTTGTLAPASVPYWSDTSLVAPGGTFEDCIPLAEGPPGGHRVAIMEQAEVRLDAESLGFTRGEPSGKGELRGWLSLPSGEAFDPVSLLYAADALPPATFDVEMAGWVPTLQLTVYVRSFPAPGPVKVIQRAQLIQGRMVDEMCYVWDSEGALAPISTTGN